MIFENFYMVLGGGQRQGQNIRFYESVQNGYFGNSYINLYVIMHEIKIFFIFVNFGIYSRSFQMKSKVCKFETFWNYSK